MNSSLKIFGLLILLCVSFYYTNEFSLLIKKNDPVYTMILDAKDKYKEEAVDAVILGDFITPGISGVSVDVQKSFKNMKKYQTFYETGLVMKEELPNNSLNNNKDKIINKGNKLKHSVAFVTNNILIKNYLDSINVKYTFLLTKDLVNENILGEIVNNDIANYKDIENYLNSKNTNNFLCYVKDKKDLCLKNKKIMFQETIKLSNNNFAKDYLKVTSGAIVYLDDLSIEYLKILIDNIKFRGYKMVTVSNMISEYR